MLLVPVLSAALAVTGCSGGGGGEGAEPAAAKPTFDGSQELKQAATAMAGLKSLGLTLSTEGKPAVPVRGGELKLLRGGDADGTVTLEQSGQTVEMKIIATGETFYVKGATGGWQRYPKAVAAAMYDPSAVLDPQRGISALLQKATGVKAEATENVAGKEAHRVRATLPRDAIGGLVPGLTTDVSGQIWVAKADHRLLKVRGEIPAAAEGGEKGSVVITFTEFDAPYKIKAPE
ncbi:LppX_LprAFG lipoprotein [Spirillospora sp. NPDC029432]|uniref:LppX_LprAFG lipoprotein n=1 Tax=Spirillospora sp. NPDC029432 TaxID=3154599 RepID=UPI0034521F52